MDYKNQPVLARLVKSVLNDLAKVVIDCRKNKSSNKGGFITVHKGKHEVVKPNNKNINLLKIDGCKAQISYPHLKIIQQINNNLQPVYGGQPVVLPKPMMPNQPSSQGSQDQKLPVFLTSNAHSPMRPS